MQTAKLYAGDKMVVARLEIATGFRRRFLGLMGRKEIEKDYGLFFPKCNNIHSMFMKTEFDLAFTDKKMVITEIIEKVAPWKIISSKKSTHCFELAPGKVAEMEMNIGQLLVIR